MDWNNPEIQFLVESIREAARLAVSVQIDLAGAHLSKDDRSPVTVADFGAQALVACRLQTTFPDSVLVGEESSEVLKSEKGEAVLPAIVEHVRQFHANASDEEVCDWIDRGAGEPSGSFWTLDPIDGTKGFLRGDHYAVALAKIENGDVVLGGLACPKLGPCGELSGDGGLYIAARGSGSWAGPLDGNGPWQQIRVSGEERIAQGRLLRSVDAGHTNEGQLGDLCRNLGIEAQTVGLDSQAKYAVLASGGAELLLRLISSRQPDYRELIWDQAAGCIVLEEAGGRITDLDGNRLDFSLGRHLQNNRGVCATNGVLHDRILEALAELEI